MYATHCKHERIYADVTSFTTERYDRSSVAVKESGMEDEFRIEFIAGKNQDMDEVAVTIDRGQLDALHARIEAVLVELSGKEIAV